MSIEIHNDCAETTGLLTDYKYEGLILEIFDFSTS